MCKILIFNVHSFYSFIFFSFIEAYERTRYMSDNRNKISKTKLIYSCQRGEECSAPSEQNILLIHGVDDGM